MMTAVLLSLAGGLSIAVNMPVGYPKLRVLGPLGILETKLDQSQGMSTLHLYHGKKKRYKRRITA
jgi:hypothetical protein